MNVHCKGPVRAPVTCLDPSPIRALSRPGFKNELTVHLKKASNIDTTGRKRCGVVIVARATKPSTGTAIFGAPFGGGGGDIFVAGEREGLVSWGTYPHDIVAGEGGIDWT
jgi:hypothetical protein